MSSNDKDNTPAVSSLRLFDFPYAIFPLSQFPPARTTSKTFEVGVLSSIWNGSYHIRLLIHWTIQCSHVLYTQRWEQYSNQYPLVEAVEVQELRSVRKVKWRTNWLHLVFSILALNSENRLKHYFRTFTVRPDDWLSSRTALRRVTCLIPNQNLEIHISLNRP